MRFTAAIELGGRTATGFEVSAEVVEARARRIAKAVADLRAGTA